ncbi:hypothetical protein E2P81_ATG00023 [Venturia nashicola]|nr:hypothetical protein E2P81_ATG00023 [Venturia nashicola]
MMQPMHRLTHAATGSPYLIARGDSMSFGYNPALDAAAGRRDSLFEMTESTESPRSYTYPEPPAQSRFTGLPVAALSSPTLRTQSTPSRPSTPDRRDQDNSKLKGVLWPGMDIFDSATPTARRRRNQKKDASILEQLEASSLEVQPTEAIWLPDGGLKKERVITGDVASSSSPWKSSPPRSDEERAPLAELPLRKPNFGRRRGGQLGSRPFNTYADDVAEQRLSYPAKRKRPFQVYKDHDSDPEDDDEAQPRASFTRPAPMTYLTRGLGKENEHQISMKQEQNPYPARFNANPFERPSHGGDDPHQYRPTNMDEYNPQGYTSSNNLLRLADVAATSAPFQTNANMSNAYHNTPSTPYGLGYNSHFMHPSQVSGFQQQYQYQMQNQHPAVHASSHMRSISATAGPIHARSISNGMHPLGMSQHHPFGAYGYGHGHPLQSMDQPSMFSNSPEIWGFGTNGGLYEHGSRSAGGSVFDQPTPAPLSEPLNLSPVRLHDIEEAPPSNFRSTGDDEVMASHHSEDNELPIDDSLSDRPSCGQLEESEDENRTITAPGTPYA